MYDLWCYCGYRAICWTYPKSERDAYRRGVGRRSYRHGVSPDAFQDSNHDRYTDEYAYADNDNNAIRHARADTDVYPLRYTGADNDLHAIGYTGTY